MKFNLLPCHAGFLKLAQNVSSMINIQEREPYQKPKMKKTLNIILHSGVYEPISFTIGMMVDVTKLYSLILI